MPTASETAGVSTQSSEPRSPLTGGLARRPWGHASPALPAPPSSQRPARAVKDSSGACRSRFSRLCRCGSLPASTPGETAPRAACHRPQAVLTRIHPGEQRGGLRPSQGRGPGGARAPAPLDEALARPAVHRGGAGLGQSTCREPGAWPQGQHGPRRCCFHKEKGQHQACQPREDASQGPAAPPRSARRASTNGRSPGPCPLQLWGLGAAGPLHPPEQRPDCSGRVRRQWYWSGLSGERRPMACALGERFTLGNLLARLWGWRANSAGRPAGKSGCWDSVQRPRPAAGNPSSWGTSVLFLLRRPSTDWTRPTLTTEVRGSTQGQLTSVSTAFEKHLHRNTWRPTLDRTSGS